MDLRQLRYLVALAEELSFTRAAASEHVAQPALSQQIRRLEDELGLALVERTTRRVALTEAGELLVVRARRILIELESAHTELQALRGMYTGHVNIGAMHTMGPVDLSLALALFHERHPGVGLTVREQTSEEMAEMLRVDELDLAFLSVTERVESHGLGLAPALGRGARRGAPPRAPPGQPHPGADGRAGGGAVHQLSPGLAAARAADRGRPEAGYEPRVTLESNESQRIRRLVARGLGVAILPRSDAEGPGAEVCVATLTDPALTRDITLAWREGRRHAPGGRRVPRARTRDVLGLRGLTRFRGPARHLGPEPPTSTLVCGCTGAGRDSILYIRSSAEPRPPGFAALFTKPPEEQR